MTYEEYQIRKSALIQRINEQKKKRESLEDLLKILRLYDQYYNEMFDVPIYGDSKDLSEDNEFEIILQALDYRYEAAADLVPYIERMCVEYKLVNVYIKPFKDNGEKIQIHNDSAIEIIYWLCKAYYRKVKSAMAVDADDSNALHYKQVLIKWSPLFNKEDMAESIREWITYLGEVEKFWKTLLN